MITHAGRTVSFPFAVVLSLAFLTCCLGVPAAEATSVLTTEQMQADLRVLIDTVGAVHPALTDNVARQAFTYRAEKLLDDITEPLPLGAYSLLAARVMRMLPEPDAHTMVGFPSDDLVLPVTFDWVRDGLVITRATADAPLRPGDDVVSIGGLSSDDLLMGLRSFISAENDHWIQVRGKKLLPYRYILDALGAVSDDGAVAIVVRRSSDTAGDVDLHVTLSFTAPNAEDPWLTQLAYRFTGTGPATVRTPRPSKPELIFTGDLYILTSSQTFSSSAWLAVVMSDNDLATIIGEPTGSAPSGYGDILFFDLPETGLTYVVSHKYWIRPDPTRAPSDTLLPDVLIPTTIDDIRTYRDPQLEWVRSALPSD